MKLMREKRELVELDSKLARRSVNEGFHSVGGGDLKAAADKEGLTKTTQVFTGLNFNF